MMTSLHKIAPEVRAAIETTIREKLKGYDLESVSIEPGEDHDGDEAIFIELNYKLNERPFDSALIGAVRSDFRSRLVDLGELRFPYTRHNLQLGQKFKE